MCNWRWVEPVSGVLSHDIVNLPNYSNVISAATFLVQTVKYRNIHGSLGVVEFEYAAQLT
jgi:hypothetical protein